VSRRTWFQPSLRQPGCQTQRLTRGFASPPRGGFALIGNGSSRVARAAQHQMCQTDLARERSPRSAGELGLVLVGRAGAAPSRWGRPGPRRRQVTRGEHAVTVHVTAAPAAARCGWSFQIRASPASKYRPLRPSVARGMLDRSHAAPWRSPAGWASAIVLAHSGADARGRRTCEPAAGAWVNRSGPRGRVEMSRCMRCTARSLDHREPRAQPFCVRPQRTTYGFTGRNRRTS
jgi:hypothetical protein